MGRKKRGRKLSSKARQERRRRALDAQIVRAAEYMQEQRDRSEMRREILASPDVPELMKTVLGAMVDPIGYAMDKIGELVFEKGETFVLSKGNPTKTGTVTVIGVEEERKAMTDDDIPELRLDLPSGST